MLYILYHIIKIYMSRLNVPVSPFMQWFALVMHRCTDYTQFNHNGKETINTGFAKSRYHTARSTRALIGQLADPTANQRLCYNAHCILVKRCFPWFSLDSRGISAAFSITS